VLLALSWTLKVYIHPSPILATNPQVTATEIFMQRASVGLAPGWLVVLVGFLFNASIVLIAFGTLKLRDASSEVLPSEELEWHPIRQVSSWAENSLKKRNTIRRAKKARQRVRSIHKTES
jgi:hypothetical protein